MKTDKKETVKFHLPKSLKKRYMIYKLNSIKKISDIVLVSSSLVSHLEGFKVIQQCVLDLKLAN